MDNSKSPSLKTKSGSRLADWLYPEDQNESRTSRQLGNALKPASSSGEKDYSLLDPNRSKVVDPAELGPGEKDYGLLDPHRSKIAVDPIERDRLINEYVDQACLNGKVALGKRAETAAMASVWSVEKLNVEIAKLKTAMTEKIKNYQI